MNYRIEINSCLDSDMNLVEWMVQSRQDNMEAQQKLHSYYISRLYDYWIKFLSDIDSETEIGAEKDIERLVSVPTLDLERRDLRLTFYGITLEHYNYTLDEIAHNFTNEEDTAQYLYPMDYPLEISLKGKFAPYRADLSNRLVDKFDKKRAISTRNDLFNFIDGQMYYKSTSIYQGKKKEFLKQNIKFFEERFFNAIQCCVEKYQQDQQADLKYFRYLFGYIAALISFEPHPDFVTIYEEDAKIMENIYFLPVDDGLFGLNSYLYAYFNDIYLVGVPNSVSRFDDEEGTPLEFMHHDITHSALVSYIEPQNKLLLKEIYHKILDHNIETRLKEMLITIIWFIIHELNVRAFPTKQEYMAFIPKAHKYFKTHRHIMQFDELVSSNIIPNIADFENLYNSYSDITESPESIILINKYFEKIGNSKHERFMKSGYAYIFEHMIMS